MGSVDGDLVSAGAGGAVDVGATGAVAADRSSTGRAFIAKACATVVAIVHAFAVPAAVPRIGVTVIAYTASGRNPVMMACWVPVTSMLTRGAPGLVAATRKRMPFAVTPLASLTCHDTSRLEVSGPPFTTTSVIAPAVVVVRTTAAMVGPT
jgi:hypothetical protein